MIVSWPSYGFWSLWRYILFFNLLLYKKITFLCLLQLGLIIRAATSGHIPPYNFIGVTMGSTAVLLVGWRAIRYKVFPVDNGKKNDVYRRGNPFELFEVRKLLHYQHPKCAICLFMPFLSMNASSQTGFHFHILHCFLIHGLYFWLILTDKLSV